jgi:hypothetical protein
MPRQYIQTTFHSKVMVQALLLHLFEKPTAPKFVMLVPAGRTKVVDLLGYKGYPCWYNTQP